MIKIHSDKVIEDRPYGANIILPPDYPHKSTFYKNNSECIHGSLELCQEVLGSIFATYKQSVICNHSWVIFVFVWESNKQIYK